MNPPDNDTKHFNLKTYSEMFEDDLSLDNTISIFLTSPIEFYNPYKNWLEKIPIWWNVYNKLKHDRLNNFHLGTYDIVIQCMIALHQLISRARIFTNLLIKAGWFNEQGAFIPELIIARISESGIPIGIIPCETELFISPLSENFVDFNNDFPLSCTTCDFSERVKNILTIDGYY